MKSVVWFTLYIFGINLSSADYYWRDYDGSIPCDAVQGGTDNLGYYTYIGQVAAIDFESCSYPDIVSATIYTNDVYAYAAYHGKIFKTSKGVKILCSAKRNKIKWSDKLDHNCKLIRGSFSANYTNFYIGRARYQDQNVTGRFSINDRILHAPWKPTPNTLQTFKFFESLMYCSNDELLSVAVE